MNDESNNALTGCLMSLVYLLIILTIAFAIFS